LGFGFVFAQSQATAGMLLRSSLAKTPKFLAAELLQYFFKREEKKLEKSWTQLDWA
jgi:hypothetical protein